MGSSKKQTIGYWYKYLMHFGLCKGPVDALLEMRVGDRTAWRGQITTSRRQTVNVPNLFGGEKAEGGLQGDMDVQMGEMTQGPNSYLAANLGAAQPTYRNKMTIVWRGGRWSAMNPYPKPAAFKVLRILRGWDGDAPWYPETASVPLIPPSPLALYIALDLSGSMDTMTANGRTRLQNAKSAIVAALQFIGATLAPMAVPLDIMIVGWGGTTADFLARQSILRRNVTLAGISQLVSWVNGRSASIGFYTYFPAAVADAAGFFGGAPSSAARISIFITDGEPSIPGGGGDPSAAATEAGQTLLSIPGIQAYGINIDLEDTSQTAKLDNTPDGGVPVLHGDNPEELITAIMSALGGVMAINPIHVLYDSLTAADMQGEPVALINDASFRAAAQRCYSEGLGVCTTYDGSEIEAFQQRLMDIVGGACTQSRVDGLYYVDLIRADVDIGTLPIIGADDILEFTQAPAVLTEQVNQVIVQWFDQGAKCTRTTQPMQALGAIRAAGRVLTETREYPEISADYLALRLAARDLRAASVPLSRFTLVTNRRPWQLRPGQQFRLQYPEAGIADAVCVVGEIDLGTPTDGRIRITAVQDVFGLPSAVYVTPEAGQAVPDDPRPAAAPAQHAIEVPYVELISAMARADFDALPPDAGLLMTMAVQPGSALNYNLATAGEGEAYGTRALADWTPSALAAEDAGYLDTQIVITAAARLDQVELGSWALWDAEIVRIDGLDLAAGTVTLGRGCADTTPAPHAAGSRIWFCGDWAGTDARDYPEGETVRAKVLPRTISDQLPLTAAPEMIVGMARRQDRPYPPGRLRLNGDAYPPEVGGDVEIAFATRDRIQQADQLIDTTVADIGPEPGASVDLEIIDRSTGTVVHAEAGVSSPLTVPSASVPYLARVALWGVRGGLRSLQALAADFAHGAAPWTPAALAVPPKVWLDWSSPLTEVSGAASSWGNAAGSLGGSFTQSTASNRPLVMADEINGRRVLRFDGSNDSLQASAPILTALNNVPAAWLLVVARKTAADAVSMSRRLAAFESGASSGTVRAALYWDDATVGGANSIVLGGRRLDNDAYYGAASAEPSYGEWRLIVGVVDYMERSLTLALDGAIDSVTTGAWTGAGNTSATNSRTANIGGGASAGSNFAGDIACVLAGSGSLSAEDRQRLEGWAAWECGLVDSLPTDHPYKAARPYL